MKRDIEHRKEHNCDAEWLRKNKKETGSQQQIFLVTIPSMISTQSKNNTKLETAWQRLCAWIWLKKLSTLHDRAAEQSSKILNGEERLSRQPTLGNNLLCLKDTNKGNALDNFRPIS